MYRYSLYPCLLYDVMCRVNKISIKEEKKNMADEIDLYDDRGSVLAKGVPLEAISPLKNAAIRR